ncbi:UDP-N-acetylmuramoyl-tripeptide--D-alanyl-D-alanine ligase [Streptomyces sp. NPDC050617]|uniref:UDP-N-acetylmuramoyl-tripeptide--D-alanyl-D- alanine ligase n=1 Tax=Streptomyces sp. NPDC050617 TaxID=3154628 RepID=UPI00341FAE69
MIPLSLNEIAAVVGGTGAGGTIVGGTGAGDGEVTVTAPAVLDSRRAEPGGLFAAFAGEHTDGHDYAAQAGRAGAVAVLGSRPTPLPTVVVDDARAALQALAAHVVARLRTGLTVIALTGSQGKTSTKDLLAAVVSSTGPTVATAGSLNNELGVPLTMLRADPATRFLVLEMGARRVGDIAGLTGLVAPDIAVVLNVGQAHLGEFGSRAAIARTKGELVRGLAPGGTAVLNADDPRVVAMRPLTDGPVLTFGRAEHADVRALGLALDRLGRPSFTLRTADASAPVALPHIGAHQALNASAAVAAGLAAGVPLDAATAALAAASLSKWRMEPRDLTGGALLLNDAYNANPDSTRAALDALAAIEGRRRIAVLGEMLELGAVGEAEHRAVGAYAASRADVVAAVGKGAGPIADGAGERAVTLADNGAAVDWLRGQLAAGDVVLVKASRGARLDEVADALEWGEGEGDRVRVQRPRRLI